MYLVKSGHLTAITLQTKHISRKKNKFISISSIVLWEVIPWLIKIRKYGEVTMISHIYYLNKIKILTRQLLHA